MNLNGHVIVVDLGYGDAGKGTIVDWLCARSDARGHPVHSVVRFNGGAQAAHHVLAPGSGEPHPFAQFGSGTFTPGTRTFLSRFMLVDPLALVKEAEHLTRLGVKDPFGLISIDRDALLTTPYHRAANRAREQARGGDRHGSCGMGIGETASYALAHPQDAPRVTDMTTPRVLERKLALLRDRLRTEFPGALAFTGRQGLPPPADVAAVYRAVAARVALTGDGYLKRLLRQGRVVFEGAQGVLLDEWRGFHPYTTWSTTTFENAETLLRENDAAMGAARLGVTRTYQTRHGPGPFPTEDPQLETTERHNADGRWQGPFRVGHLDTVTLKYAAEVTGGVDAIALTHLDTALSTGPNRASRLKVAAAYDLEGRLHRRIRPGPSRDLAYQEELTAALTKAVPVYHDAPRTEAGWRHWIASLLRAPVAITSRGPAVTDKTWHPQQRV